jgi:uncharacterized Fe-S center protein
MSKVYWIKGRSVSIYKDIVSKIDVLLGLDEMARLVVEGESLAIKINMSELGYEHYLRPVVVSTLFEKFRSMGVKACVTDTCSLFRGSRFEGYEWSDTALVQGFSNGEIFDQQLMLAGGYSNEEGKFWPSEGKNLAGVELGSLLTDTYNLVVLSHVTAHPILGLAGAISNLGLGFLTKSGKLRVHACLELGYDEQKCDNCQVCLPFCPTGAISEGKGKISFDPRICNKCLGCFIACPHGAFRVKPEGIPAFQESVVEAAHTARENLRGDAFFINFLSSVTPQTDEYPYSDIPFIPDLGILASEDPVAIDLVTSQMILRSPGIPGSMAQDLNVLDKGQDKIKAITGNTPEHMLEYAEGMNLGNSEIELLASG